MSTWTSKRPLAALALGLILLAGCVPAGGSGALATPVRVQPVLDGAVRVAAPPGYCVDPASVMRGQDSAIVLIGRCRAGTQTAPAILTAAVGAAGSAIDVATGSDDLAAFFGSRAGRVALSRSGRADTVRVIEAVGTPDAFLIRLSDTSPNPYGPAEPESWRAVTSVGGRLVTLTVSGTADAPLAPAAGRALIERFVAAMAAANRGLAG